MRVLALGDSYTIGEAVAPEQRWIAHAMRKLALAPAPDVEIIARTGWTTDELDAAITAAQPAHTPYDLVTLLIGVNNQYRGRPVGEYREQLSALLRRALHFAGGRGGRVVVLSIPDWGVTPFAGNDADRRARIAREIDAYNAAKREVVEGAHAGVHFVDITPNTRLAASDPQRLLASDGLHPSGVMYEQWADLALPAVRAALGLAAV